MYVFFFPMCVVMCMDGEALSRIHCNTGGIRVCVVLS